MTTMALRPVQCWFVSTEQGKIGPFSATKIMAMLWAGRIRPFDELAPHGGPRTHGTLTSFFPELTRQLALESLVRGQRRVGLPRLNAQGDVSVRSESGQSIDGELIDFSDRGVFFWVPEDRLPVGATFRVDIRSPRLFETLTVLIEVKRKDACVTAGMRYGCRIVAFYGGGEAVLQAYMLDAIAGAGAVTAAAS